MDEKNNIDTSLSDYEEYEREQEAEYEYSMRYQGGNGGCCLAFAAFVGLVTIWLCWVACSLIADMVSQYIKQ